MKYLIIEGPEGCVEKFEEAFYGETAGQLMINGDYLEEYSSDNKAFTFKVCDWAMEPSELMLLKSYFFGEEQLKKRNIYPEDHIFSFQI